MERERHDAQSATRTLVGLLATEPARTLARLRSDATLALLTDRDNELLREWRRLLNEPASKIREILVSDPSYAEMIRAAHVEQALCEMTLDDQVKQTRVGDIVNSMNRSDRFSYELHQAVAERMRTEPDVVVRHALRNLDTWATRTGKRHGAEDQWREILRRPIDEAIEAFVALSDAGQLLRSSSVFAGLLSQEQRLEILRDVNALMAGLHGS